MEYPFVKAHRVESDLVQFGGVEGKIVFHKIQVYDCDLTICDVLWNMALKCISHIS